MVNVIFVYYFKTMKKQETKTICLIIQKLYTLHFTTLVVWSLIVYMKYIYTSIVWQLSDIHSTAPINKEINTIKKN